MSARKAAFLQEMGLAPRWTLRHAPVHAVLAAELEVVREAAQVSMAQEASDLITPIVVQAASVSAALVDGMDWQQLQQGVAACSGCGLCAGRSNTVFGAGDRKANWLFIGAAPNAADDAAGQPLTGDSGSLFSNMLRAIGLQPEQNVYVTNLLKCFPAPGVDVSASLNACRPYLARQITLLEPTIIVALGADVAVALLSDVEANLSGLRGKVHRYADLPLVVTYAPVELLRSPAAKAGAWSDLCLARDTALHSAFAAGLNADAAR